MRQVRRLIGHFLSFSFAPQDLQCMPPKYRGRRPSARASNEPAPQGRVETHADTTTTVDRRRAATQDHHKRSASPIFWAAETETYLFRGPLGEPVGHVSAGTVLREWSRYEDPYGGWWCSTRSSDGSLVWFCHSDPGAMEPPSTAEPSAAVWVRVFDSRATPESEQTIRSDALLSIQYRNPLKDAQGAAICVSLQNIYEAMRGTEEAPSDVALFDFYWAHLDAAPKDRPSWNTRYQSALDGYFFHSSSSEELLRHREAVESTIAAFNQTVEECVVTIVQDLVKPPHEKVLKTHPLFRHVFYKDGILFRLVMDLTNGAMGGDQQVIMAERHRFLALQALAMTSLKHLLYLPLSALCRFQGFYVFATAVPPIDMRCCVYSPLTTALQPGSGVDTHASRLPASLCAALGEAMNLKEHECQLKSSTSSSSASLSATDQAWRSTLGCSTEVYAGRDKRFYIVMPCTLFPPAPLQEAAAPRPPRAASAASSSSSSPPPKPSYPWCKYARRLRPELVFSATPPLNADLMVQDCYTAEDETEYLALMNDLRGEGISSVADIVGFHQPIERDCGLLPANCTLCEREMTNEMRFIVCCHSDQCCKVCAHCYCQRMSEAHHAAMGPGLSGEEAMTKVKFCDAVRCGSRDRSGHALLPEPSVTRLMHAYGLNLSLLPFVFHRLPLETAFMVEHFLKVEICARGAASALQLRMSHATSAEEAQRGASDFFSSFLSSSGPAAEALWAKELGPLIMSKYPSLGGPLTMTFVARELLCERAQEVCCVQLSRDSLLSLSNPEESFVTVESILPKTKRFHAPMLSMEQAGEAEGTLASWLERLLIFWIAFEDKHALAGDEEPFYFSHSKR